MEAWRKLDSVGRRKGGRTGVGLGGRAAGTTVPAIREVVGSLS